MQSKFRSEGMQTVLSDGHLHIHVGLGLSRTVRFPVHSYNNIIYCLSLLVLCKLVHLSFDMLLPSECKQVQNLSYVNNQKIET